MRRAVMSGGALRALEHGREFGAGEVITVCSLRKSTSRLTDACQSKEIDDGHLSVEDNLEEFTPTTQTESC